MNAVEDSGELRRGDFRDPCEVLIQWESWTCVGCVHAVYVFNAAYCERDRQYGRRCQFYREVECGER